MRKSLMVMIAGIFGWIYCLNLSAVQADFISTPSEQGSPSFHEHLVRPGTLTSYIIRVNNPWRVSVDLELSLEAEPKALWSAELSASGVNDLKPGDYQNVLLVIKPDKKVKPGEVFEVMVRARSSNGYEDSLKVSAQATNLRKIYFISIDSLDPRYLKLNARGDGYGKEGDWLMPNLHRLMQSAVFYPNANCHIITATDMNHYNILAGTMTGTSGISLVGGFVFGVDQKGNFIIKNSSAIEKNIIRYGPEGKPVPSLFNAVKKANAQAWTAFVSGKNWVPTLYRFPELQIDRIIHGQQMPDWIISLDSKPKEKLSYYENTLKVLLPDARVYEKHSMGNPAKVKETPDPRYHNLFAMLGELLPSAFPSDRWVMDSALLELLNEDPDVFYILLAVTDDAGHAFGSAFDLSEWDSRGTETLSDDVSKYDYRASRQAILNVVREADHQVGRLLDLLQQRGTLEETILVAESDHSMITYYRRSLNMSEPLKQVREYKPKKDYGFGSAADIGMVGAIRQDAKMLMEIETALENWKVKNPLTGEKECPVVVYNREEMKSGFDQATHKQWMLPREYYSEYYIEHRKEGEQLWPDLLVLAKPHYKFQIRNFGLGNLGVSNIQLPPAGYFIGGHGSFETRPILLMLSVPGQKPGVIEEQVYTMDVVPTLYKIQGWQMPESVDGKGLPGIQLK